MPFSIMYLCCMPGPDERYCKIITLEIRHQANLMALRSSKLLQVANSSCLQFTICCQETVAEADMCDVPPGECVPFWPVQTSKKMQMRVKVKDKGLETMPFYFTEAHTTLLPLDQEVQYEYLKLYMVMYPPSYELTRRINEGISPSWYWNMSTYLIIW